MACLPCNLKYSSLHQLKIPIIMHNSSGYDLHFIIRSLHKVNDRISIVPKNSEQYLALQLGSFVFIDSYQHFSESLSILAMALRDKGSGSFHYTSKDIADEQKRDLLLRKGVFCYSYLDDTKKFDERRLPAWEKFFNDLEQENISEQDYKHACKVWKSFCCQSLGDYHDVYLKSDLLILADVFENFRKFFLLNYELDAAHYLSGPQLVYDALFKLTWVELDLLTHIDMYQMVEKGICGGYAGVIQWCARQITHKCQSMTPIWRPASCFTSIKTFCIRISRKSPNSHVAAFDG